VTEVSIDAIRPSSVCIPVAVTTIVAVPRVTDVFWKSMSVRSPSATSGVDSVAAAFGTGALSPVNAASCTSRVAERTIRPSAGTRSPASTWTMSPGTRSTAGARLIDPSRSTRVCGTCRRDRASTLARADSSCRAPSTTLRAMSRPTMSAVDTSPMRRLTATTATNMMFMGSASCCIAIRNAEGGFSATIRFGPWRVSRAAASLPVSPVSTLVVMPATTASASWANHGRGPSPPTSGFDWTALVVSVMERPLFRATCVLHR
jgi:hypothetical protein